MLGHWLSEEMGARTKFFQTLEKFLDDLGIKDMPERIYNLDETGLSLDPKKSKAFSHRGSKNVQYVVCLKKRQCTLFSSVEMRHLM
eukprot:gene8667-9600_t